MAKAKSILRTKVLCFVGQRRHVSHILSFLATSSLHQLNDRAHERPTDRALLTQSPSSPSVATTSSLALSSLSLLLLLSLLLALLLSLLLSLSSLYSVDFSPINTNVLARMWLKATQLS